VDVGCLIEQLVGVGYAESETNLPLRHRRAYRGGGFCKKEISRNKGLLPLLQEAHAMEFMERRLVM
jgi:hypothetical protein